MASSTVLYSRRIARRRQAWWGPFWRDPRDWRRAVHRERERRTFLGRAAPDAQWRCCADWPRRLLNKWNSREFAARHGVRVPALYWHGPRSARLPLDSLPNAFVIRPTWGTARQGIAVFVDGVDLLRGERLSPTTVRRRVRGARPLFTTWSDRVLVEEFISLGGSRRLPVEYKCHMFGGRVGVIEAIHRTAAQASSNQFYTASWEPIADCLSTYQPEAPVESAPPHLAEMLRAASVLGTEIGTYMRIDFFMSDEGCVFNEVASTPRGLDSCTAVGDAFFGALWDESCPSAI